MSVGLPLVSSPVGVTTDIIEDGVNGFLATTVDEWVDKLARLVESADLRRESAWPAADRRAEVLAPGPGTAPAGGARVGPVGAHGVPLPSGGRVQGRVASDQQVGDAAE